MNLDYKLIRALGQNPEFFSFHIEGSDILLVTDHWKEKVASIPLQYHSLAVNNKLRIKNWQIKENDVYLTFVTDDVKLETLCVSDLRGMSLLPQS